jgi:phosphatidylglycerophosphate synthase
VRWRPQHILSIARAFLGIVVFLSLRGGGTSYAVLPAVACACAADFLDGFVARRRGEASGRGRLLDNLADATFLALAFCGFAQASTWSDPVAGSATRYWEHANWLPVVGLAASFGTYLARWAVAVARREPMPRSTRGHHAGVLNYVLAVVGAVAVLPGVRVTPWLLEPLSVTVALFNVMAALDTVSGLATGES